MILRKLTISKNIIQEIINKYRNKLQTKDLEDLKKNRYSDFYKLYNGT